MALSLTSSPLGQLPLKLNEWITSEEKSALVGFLETFSFKLYFMMNEIIISEKNFLLRKKKKIWMVSKSFQLMSRSSFLVIFKEIRTKFSLNWTTILKVKVKRCHNPLLALHSPMSLSCDHLSTTIVSNWAGYRCECMQAKKKGSYSDGEALSGKGHAECCYQK